MLYAPVQRFLYRASNVPTTRPSMNLGDSLTPGNNTMGTAVTLFSSGEVPCDIYEIVICINSGATSTAARDILIDILCDPAGGTSWAVKIPYLLSGGGGPVGSGQVGTWYKFPVYFPAGSSIGARASVNNATVGTVRVFAKIVGRPLYPELVRAGPYVIAVGATAASSSGTAITSGTTSEGTWTSLGTISVPVWYWQLGVGLNNGTWGGVTYGCDLSVGDATNKSIVIEEEIVSMSGGEAQSKILAGPYDWPTPSGAEVFARLQSSGTADSNLSVAAYGVVY